MLNKMTTLEAMQALESEYWRDLMSRESGKWLIHRLIDQSKSLQVIPFEGGGKEVYAKGKQDLIMNEVVSRIVKHCGYKALDNIMKKDITDV